MSADDRGPAWAVEYYDSLGKIHKGFGRTLRIAVENLAHNLDREAEALADHRVAVAKAREDVRL